MEAQDSNPCLSDSLVHAPSLCSVWPTAPPQASAPWQPQGPASRHSPTISSWMVFTALLGVITTSHRYSPASSSRMSGSFREASPLSSFDRDTEAPGRVIIRLPPKYWNTVTSVVDIWCFLNQVTPISVMFRGLSLGTLQTIVTLSFRNTVWVSLAISTCRNPVTIRELCYGGPLKKHRYGTLKQVPRNWKQIPSFVGERVSRRGSLVHSPTLIYVRSFNFILLFSSLFLLFCIPYNFIGILRISLSISTKKSTEILIGIALTL